jgi:hypothetical protein
MDDYTVSSLSESKNEWCARLVNTLTMPIIQGFKSIFDEAWKLCEENTQKDKYLMTFQTFLTRVPQWNATIIETEQKRINETSGCGYLEELITCVHVIHLKALTCVRVGQKQKKIDLNIPSINEFIHKIYINVARKLYTTIYLFEKNIPPLEVQKRNRELECIIKECILNTVRESIPVENILRAYMDETVEQDVEVKEVIEETPIPQAPQVLDDNDDNDNGNDNGNNNGNDNGNNNGNINNNNNNNGNINNNGNNNGNINNDNGNDNGNNNNGNNDNGNNNDNINNISNGNGNGNKQDTLIYDMFEPSEIKNTIPTETMQNIKISFSDQDMTRDIAGNDNSVNAPKTIERLEELSNKEKEYNNDDDDDNDNDTLQIGGDIELDFTDVNNLNKNLELNDPPILDDIEILN